MKTLILLAMLLPINSWASSWAGSWQGQGQFSMFVHEQSTKYDCDHVEIAIEQNEELIQIQECRFYISYPDQMFLCDHFKAAIRNKTELWFNNKKVGHISDQALHAEVEMDGKTFTWDFAKQAEVFKYKHHSINGDEWMHEEAALQKAPGLLNR